MFKDASAFKQESTALECFQRHVHEQCVFECYKF
jgi:hypothetical protein